MVHNDSTNLELHLNSVDDSTVNVISIVIRGKNVQWCVNDSIALVIFQHLIESIQIRRTCQKCKM